MYEPRGAARELFHCRHAEILMDGPAGTGKTRAILQKIDALCDKYPRSRHLVTRASRASMSETVLVTFEKIVMGAGHPVVHGGAHRAFRQHYVYPNGSEIIVCGMDNADRIMSGEFDTASVFEATEITEDDLEKIITRLRWEHVPGVQGMPYKQVLCDCNPGAPGHWLNRRASSGRMTRLLSRHTDNPSLTAEYLESLARLTGVRRLRLFEGKWAGSEGLVYDRFDRSVHVRERHDTPVRVTPVRVVLGVDDGYTNPCAVVRLEVDGDGRVHVRAEHYQPGLSESAKVEAVRRLADGAERIFIDPAAAGLKGALRNAGLPVRDGDNDVVAGINRVQDRLCVQGDGLPRLTVEPTCVKLIDEFESYEWLPDKPKDTPKKESDHALDALRYAVMGLGGASYTVHGSEEPARVSFTPEQVAEAQARGLNDWLSGRDLD